MKWFDMIPPELYGEPQKKPSGSAIGFTGFGSDGRLQPSNPTNMVQTMQGPRLLHEGEATMQGPDGNIQVIPQDKLRSIGRGMPGFEAGGIFTPADPKVTGLGTTSQTTNSGLGTPKTPETDVQQGIGVLKSVASGKSPVTESLYNQATSNLGGAQTAAIGAAKQEAAQAGYTKEGIGSVAQTTARNMEGERSKLMGSLASATQNNMVNAANNLVTAGTNERGYTDTQNTKDWNEALLYNDPDTPQGQAALTAEWKRTHPTSTTVPDFNVMREERNYAKTQREQSITQGQQAIQVGAFNVDNARIQNDANKFQVEPSKMLALVAAINNGSVPDAVSASNFLGKPVSQAEFDSMRSDRTYTESLRNVNLLSAKTQLDILKGSMKATEYDDLKQKIKDGATLDEIQKENPNFSPAVYTALNRELTIEQGLQSIQLKNAQASTDSATWNAFVQKVKDSNGKLTPDQLKEQFPGLNVTQELINGVMSDKTLGLAKDSFTEALLYNNPNTETGIAAIQQAWVDAHPGKTLKDAPDFQILKEEAAAAQQERKNNAVTEAGKLADALIADSIDTNGESITATNILTSKTYQGAINNQNLKQSIATMYDWNITDPRINGIIKSKIETAIKGDVDVLVQKFIDEKYIPEIYKDTPGWEGQLKRSIQDMLNSGVMDKDGNLTGSGAYPWDDPSTFNNYTDWNGNDIVYDKSGNKPDQYYKTNLVFDGNGVDYYTSIGIDGKKIPVTMWDMDKIWNTLSESDKAKYFSDESGNPIDFNKKAFMNKYFLNGTSASGKSVGGGAGGVMLSPDKIDNYLFSTPENGVLDKITGNIMGDPNTNSVEFSSSSKYPGTPGEGTDPNAGASLSTLHAYQYYDDKGVLHSDGSTANGGDARLNKIWLQFSQMYNGGEVMTSQQFKGYWKEGEGWYIDSDGIVTNFSPSFKEKYGTNGQYPKEKYNDLSSLSKESVNDYEKYKELVNDKRLKDWKPELSYKSGAMGFDNRKFVNAPPVGDIIRYGGEAYEVLSLPINLINTEVIKLKSLKDGTTKMIKITGDGQSNLSLSFT